MRTGPPNETGRDQDMRRELGLAYEALTDVTSRLLLANEAGEAALSGEDGPEISERFLATVARGMEARRAGLFLVEGDDFELGAVFGLSDEDRDALSANTADLDVCRAAIEARGIQVLDEDLVAADAHEAIAAATGSAGVAGGEGDAEEIGETAEGVAVADDQDEEEDEGEQGDEDEPEDEEDRDASEARGEEEDQDEEEGESEQEAEDDGEGDRPAFFGVYLPVHLEEQPVAVLGLGERAGGRVYRNEDLVFLQYLLRQFALTLHRGTLLEEHRRRLEERDALLKVSREITSTLDLDAVLGSVVNTVAAVVPNDRAEIALTRGNKLVLRAVSGMTRLDADQAELFKITLVLEYLRTHPRRLHIGARDLGDEPPAAGHDVFSEYFGVQPMRSFMALPLKDEQGLLGFLCLESLQEGWDIHPAEGDALSIVAAQTTVAIRNATLYSEIPLRGVSLPVSRLRGRFVRLTPGGRLVAVLAAAAVVVGMFLPIAPERVGGKAEVRPLRFQGVRALTEGVVARAHVTGGEEVRRGEPLVEVEDLDLAGRLADLRAQIEGARRDIAAARRSGDLAAWRSSEIRLAGLEGTLAVEERRASGQVLRAPFAGQILELDLAQRVGQHLDPGETFCTVAALHIMAVDIEVAEEMVGRVKVGQRVAVKAMSFPTRVFHGTVSEVGWRAQVDPRGRARFTVRAKVENPGRLLRPGMTGVAKASVGRRSAAALIFAPLLRSLQMRLW